MSVPAPRFGRAHGIVFVTHFGTELKALERIVEDSLVQYDQQQLRVTPAGRSFIRNICMAFDAYPGQTTGSFSEAI